MNGRKKTSPRLDRAFLSLLLISFSLLFARSSLAGVITGYSKAFRPFYGEGGNVGIAIRKFRLDGEEAYLAVDPFSFGTDVVPGPQVEGSGTVPARLWRRTPFIRALKRYASSSGRIRNLGITTAESRTGGVFLTIDLCPSKKGIDRSLFSSTAGLPHAEGTPLPVAIAISGLWINEHKDDLGWVEGLVREGRLDVTWVNHTLTHPYKKWVAIGRNFLLTRGVDLEKEALGAEAVFLENGITPSVFFRFPGLISDSRLLKRLKSLSLIPVGADAWLAKGEAPKAGSIILVHGNGNEPEGIKRLEGFYAERKGEFETGALRLLPLRDAFAR